MRTFNVAVVGCGGMSGGWLGYAVGRKDVTIKLLVDINAQTAQDRKEEFKLDCEIATQLTEDLLQKLGIDLVLDVTIPEAHCGVVTTALKAGCDCLGEKPMSSSIEDARKMVALAQQTGKTYAVMQNYRYSREIRAYKELLSPDVIGDLGSLHADFFLDPKFDGFRAIMDSPLILDMAIHTFDMARFLSGANAVSVYCQEYNPKWSYYKGDIAASAIFEMENGLIFTYDGSWAAPGGEVGWNGRWRATGSLGSAFWDGGGNAYADIPQEGGEAKIIRPQNVWQSENTHHSACFDGMFAALAGGYAPETVCTDNIKSIEMVFGAIESSRTGKKVYLK